MGGWVDCSMKWFIKCFKDYTKFKGRAKENKSPDDGSTTACTKKDLNLELNDSRLFKNLFNNGILVMSIHLQDYDREHQP